jgi:hypothetical protein
MKQKKRKRPFENIFKGDVFEDGFGIFVVVGLDPESTNTVLIYDFINQGMDKISVYYIANKTLLARLDDSC